MKAVKFVLIVLILVLAAACNESEQKEAKKTRVTNENSHIETAFLLDVTPLANGGAYATSITGPIWYLEGAAAVKVKGLGEDNFSTEIVPTFDGGAYAVTMTSGIWRLEKNNATKVSEVSAVSGDTVVPTLSARERALFVMWQHEAGARRSAERRAEDQAENERHP